VAGTPPFWSLDSVEFIVRKEICKEILRTNYRVEIEIKAPLVFFLFKNITGICFN
jgi:hypothetical protein